MLHLRTFDPSHSKAGLLQSGPVAGQQCIPSLQFLRIKAVICDTFGGLEGLRFGAFPYPEIGSGQALIDMAVAGVNSPDQLIVKATSSIAAIAFRAPLFTWLDDGLLRPEIHKIYPEEQF